MNHSHIVREVARLEGVSIGHASHLIRTYLSVIGTTVAKGERVVLPGVGSISTSPATGRRRLRSPTTARSRTEHCVAE
jgi:nucleoid DNA-binding protein